MFFFECCVNARWMGQLARDMILSWRDLLIYSDYCILWHLKVSLIKCSNDPPTCVMKQRQLFQSDYPQVFPLMVKDWLGHPGYYINIAQWGVRYQKLSTQGYGIYIVYSRIAYPSTMINLPPYPKPTCTTPPPPNYHETSSFDFSVQCCGGQSEWVYLNKTVSRFVYLLA